MLKIPESFCNLPLPHWPLSFNLYCRRCTCLKACPPISNSLWETQQDHSTSGNDSNPSTPQPTIVNDHLVVHSMIQVNQPNESLRCTESQHCSESRHSSTTTTFLYRDSARNTPFHLIHFQRVLQWGNPSGLAKASCKFVSGDMFAIWGG